MQRKSFKGVILAVCLMVLPSVLFLTSNEVVGVSKQTLTAAKVKAAPSGLDDPIWDKAKAEVIPFEGKEKFAEKKAAVATKAVYTKDDVYFLFKWNDPTLSVTKGAWKYDGQKWNHQKGNEDRISLLFEINRIKNFATKGCAIVCHVPPGAANAKDGKFGTTTAGEKITEEKGGRKSDAGKGGDQKNMTEDKSKPKYMLAPGNKLGKHDILLASQTVQITDYAQFIAGDTITYRMPKNPEGSRSDIKAMSRYADGGWTVMLYRKLDTGHEDDVAFNPRKKYNFAMALFDDSGDENSFDSEVLTLDFRR